MNELVWRCVYKFSACKQTSLYTPLSHTYMHTYIHTHYQASNWCQTSQQFLNSMEEKVDMCDRSEEAASLTAELTLYISVTKEQQTGRVEQVYFSNNTHTHTHMIICMHVLVCSEYIYFSTRIRNT